MKHSAFGLIAILLAAAALVYFVTQCSGLSVVTGQ